MEGYPQEPQWAPGTPVGEYEIVEHIASGGMAEVYAAVPRAGGEPVVIKAMSRALLSNEEFVRLFLDEAQLIATLRHPNIGQIFDRGEARGTHYFVMEYVLGPSCREILNRAVRDDVGHIPLSHAIDICCDIADALHYAHVRRGADGTTYGVVHRDISHSNVLVTYEGVTKLIDFGVAKSSMRSTETKIGSLKGKVRYMSPEQIRGDVIDRRSDIFSLGIVLWEMTTGQRLFRGANEAAIMHKILYEEARRPADALPGYPPELEKIVMGALAREPKHRPSSGEQLNAQLTDFARRAGLQRGGVAGYLRTLFGEEIEQDRTRYQMLRRRRSAMSPVASSSVLRPHTPGFSPMSGFSPTSRRHSITTVPPPLPAVIMVQQPEQPAMQWPLPTAASETRTGSRPGGRPQHATSKERKSLVLFGAVVIGIIVVGLMLSQRGGEASLGAPSGAPRGTPHAPQIAPTPTSVRPPAPAPAAPPARKSAAPAASKAAPTPAAPTAPPAGASSDGAPAGASPPGSLQPPPR